MTSGLSKCFLLDPLLPELLVFPAQTDLHDHPLYQAVTSSCKTGREYGWKEGETGGRVVSLGPLFTQPPVLSPPGKLSPAMLLAPPGLRHRCMRCPRQ